MFRYKVDILEELKEKGYTSYKLKKDNLLGNSAIQHLRSNEMIGISSLDTICNLLHCQPGDLIEHIPD